RSRCLTDGATFAFKGNRIDMVSRFTHLEINGNNIPTTGITTWHNHIGIIHRTTITWVLVMVEQKFNSFLAVHGSLHRQKSREQDKLPCSLFIVYELAIICL